MARPRSLMRIGVLVGGGAAGMPKSAQNRRAYTPSTQGAVRDRRPGHSSCRTLRRIDRPDHPLAAATAIQQSRSAAGGDQAQAADRSFRQPQRGPEILDGEAIAELLADPELFWIAEEYLHLPAELQPPAPSGESALPDWYTGLREDWQTRDGAPASLGDLLALARGLRHATFHREARGDLPGWLSLVERLLHRAPTRPVRSSLAPRARSGTPVPSGRLRRPLRAQGPGTARQ
jgi:hypothetical protein